MTLQVTGLQIIGAPTTTTATLRWDYAPASSYAFLPSYMWAAEFPISETIQDNKVTRVNSEGVADASGNFEQITLTNLYEGYAYALSITRKLDGVDAETSSEISFYTYTPLKIMGCNPNWGLTTGGSMIQLFTRGVGAGPASVLINGNAATVISIEGDSVLCTTPAGTKGKATISISANEQTVEMSEIYGDTALFSYAENANEPIITKISPRASLLDGTGTGNKVEIRGMNFEPATSVGATVLFGTYKGTWDATTNTPALQQGIGTIADIYKVTVAGSQDFGPGSINFNSGDFVYYTGTTWIKYIPPTVTAIETYMGTYLETTIPSVSSAHSADINVLIGNDIATWTNAFSYVTQLIPTITGIQPSSGESGTSFYIDGTYLFPPLQVLFDGVPANELTAIGNAIYGRVPVHTPGLVDVVVALDAGGSATLTGGFTYLESTSSLSLISFSPTTGPVAGGTTITLLGTGFLDGTITSVIIGSTPASNINVLSDSVLTCVTPGLPAGTPYTITVWRDDGNHASSSTPFTYINEGQTIPPVLYQESATSTTAVISWTATSGATAYNIYSGTEPEPMHSTQALTYELTFATPGGFYQNVRVAAVVSGTEYMSNVIDIQLAPATPEAPTVTPVAGQPNKFNVSWSATSGATSYEVWLLASEQNAWMPLAQVSSAQLMVVDIITASLPGNTPFELYINATNSFGVTEGISTLVYSAPTIPDPTITALTSNGFTVSWPTNTAAEFKIFSGTTLLATVPRSSNQAIVSTMEPNTQITNIRVIAVGDGAGTLNYPPLESASEFIIPSPAMYTHALPPAAHETPVVNITATGATLFWMGWGIGEMYRVYSGQTLLTNELFDNPVHVIEGLSPDTTYSNYIIKAVNAAGVETPDGLQIPSFTTLALPPTGVAVQNITSASGVIVWNDTGAGYNIYLGGAKVNETPVTQHFLVSNLTPNTTYDFTIKALNRALQENPDSVSVPSFTTLAAQPTSVSANQSRTYATISWQAPIPAAESYTIRQNGVFVQTTSNLSHLVSGLTPNTTYTFTVSSRNINDTENLANPVSVTFTTLAQIADVGAENQVTDVTATSVKLHWINTGASAFNVYSPDGTTKINPAPITGTSITLTGLQPNTNYMGYTIKSINSAGLESQGEMLIHFPFLTKPQRVDNLTKVSYDAGEQKMVIRWETPVGGADSYKVLKDSVEQTVTITEV